MATDKIYVCIPQRLNLSTFKENSKYVGLAYNDKGNLRSPQIEEYIRKDALLEWAKECFRLQDEGSWYSKGAADAFSRVINKLNSM
jgi:hypothetical protein